MVMILSDTAKHNGFTMNTVARHYSEDKLPARYLRAKKKKTGRPCVQKRLAENLCLVTTEQVYEIRNKPATMTYLECGKKYGISESYCRKIHKRVSHAYLPEKQ